MHDGDSRGGTVTDDDTASASDPHESKIDSRAGRPVTRLFRSGRTSRWLLPAGLAAVAGGAGIALGGGPTTSLVTLQLAIGLLVVVIVVTLDFRRDTQLPVLMRPGTAIVVSFLVGSVSAPALSRADYTAYLTMWSALAAGIVLGLLITQSAVGSGSKEQIGFDPRRTANLSLIVIAISMVSALIFFAWQGVPALQSNIEQARVDAAAAGTGYVRLLAYIGLVGVQGLFAIRHRLASPSLLIVTAIILAMGNRSPLLYLYIPVAFVLFDQKRIKVTAPRIVLSVLVLLAVIASIGVYRVFSQSQFASYAEYRSAIASRDYAAVALTSLTHYADVIPENAVLTKHLVDDGKLEHKYGATYLTLFISALPGQQLSLDREIKQVSGAQFIGGGTPPTLMGEGYVNFGLPGTILSGAFIVWLSRYWSRRYASTTTSGQTPLSALTASTYGYIICWVVGSPVAGLAGASTVPLAGAILLITIRHLSFRKQAHT